MNILFFTTIEPTLFTGGIERFAISIANRVSEDGHKVVFVAQKKYNPDAPKTEIQQNVFILPVSDNVESEENVLFLKDIISKYEINIIFNQQADGLNIVNLCYRVKEELGGLKIISILHFSPNHSLRMFEMPFRQILSSKLPVKQKFNLLVRNTSFYRSKIKKYLHKIFINVYDKSDALVLLSEHSKPIFSELAGLREMNKLYALGNPLTNIVNIDIIRKENRILYVGRCEVLQKRINLLIDIWKKVYNQLPNWELDILGKGNYYEIAKSRVNKEKIERINFYGYRAPDEFYAKSKILVLTSSTEGFPLVLLEAANLRTPSVIFDSFESAKDIVVDGQTGYLVPPYNLELFANRLVELASNEEKLQKLSESAYLHAQKFTIDKIIIEWYNIFNKVLSIND